MIEVRRSPIHGRGVFARRRIHPGTIMERAPVLAVPVDLDGGVADHVFEGGRSWSGLALGCSALVNHDDAPNAAIHLDGRPADRRLLLVATRRIDQGDEVTISYGPKWWRERAG